MSNNLVNVGALIDSIEAPLDVIGEELTTSCETFVGAVAYAASSADRRAVIALAHHFPNSEDRHLSDKHILRRRVRSDISLVPTLFMQADPDLYDSKMFPDKYQCLYLPMMGDKKRMNRAGLKLIFNNRGHVDILRNKRCVERLVEFDLLEESLADTLTRVNGTRDEVFRIRDSYQPNVVMTYFDLSGYTALADELGGFEALRVAESFRTFIANIADGHGAYVQNFEGDGVWVAMLVKDGTDYNSVRESSIQAFRLVNDVLDGFNQYIIDHHGSKFADLKFKAAMEIGEIRNIHEHEGVDSRLAAPDNASGPVFTRIARATDLADRSQNSVLVGPELRSLGYESFAAKFPVGNFSFITRQGLDLSRM